MSHQGFHAWAMPTSDSDPAAIANDAEYQTLFQEAYGRKPNYDDVGRAIARS